MFLLCPAWDLKKNIIIISWSLEAENKMVMKRNKNCLEFGLEIDFFKNLSAISVEFIWKSIQHLKKTFNIDACWPWT